MTIGVSANRSSSSYHSTIWTQSVLLDHDSVAVLAARTHDDVVAGAILNRSSDVVGISNFFTDPRVASASWAGCLAFADRLHPGSTVVGYESGDALDAARVHGFETAGSLRVWLHEP